MVGGQRFMTFGVHVSNIFKFKMIRFEVKLIVSCKAWVKKLAALFISKVLSYFINHVY